MMYIEHTSLEDNLHQILTNRVPTSSSPGASETAAATLLARVREAHNSSSSVHAVQVPTPSEQQKCSKEARRPEPQLVPVECFKTLDTPQSAKKTPNGLGEHLQKDNEIQEEEQFELLQVYDSDQPENQVDILNPIDVERKGEVKEENSATTHFVIDLELKANQKNNTDNEEFEYIVTRVPKKRNSLVQPAPQQLYPSKFDSRDNKTTNQNYNNRPKSARRPVPGAIPIGDIPRRSLQSQQDTVFNSKADNFNEFTDHHSAAEDCDYYSDLETVAAASVNACEFENIEKDIQMGLGIFDRLKKLFSSNQSPDHFDNSSQEGKRKRRPEECAGESASERLIKYRKVENRFPKYVFKTEEDAVNPFFATPQPPKHSLSSNMSTRRSNTFLDKPPLRNSIFEVPPRTTHIIKNTLYADLEFSDDDEPHIISPSTSAAASRFSKLYSIPTSGVDGPSSKPLQKKPPPPPLIEHRTGNIFTSTRNVEPVQKFSYADAVSQNHRATLGAMGRAGNVLGTRNSSISSSAGGASSSTSSRVVNGYGSGRTNIWSNMQRSSILAQEKESEEREKYQQLLEQVVPRLYACSENKIPASSSSQRRRSELLLAAARTSSTRSSPANTRRSMGLSQSILKRPPLSSTINLDDEDDEDVTFCGISHIKPPSSRPSKGKTAAPVITLDDGDDVSEIVDLDNEDRHVLTQCAKYKQEENFLKRSETPKQPQVKALPYVEPVNSLKDFFGKSPHLKDDWMQKWSSKWSQHKQNRLVEVKETRKVAEKLAAERKAAEAEIQERLRNFQIVDPELLVIDDFEDIVEEPEFVELTPDHRARIHAAVNGPPGQVLVSKFNLNITRRDIYTLCGHNWLNDEVINFYMSLLTERGEIKNKSHGLPSVYAMNTFFVPRLIQAGHAGVKRWTRKVDIFSKDVVPVPVHVGGVHWCMAIIHMKNRTIKYYDSMGTPNPTVLKALEQYLKEESMDKRKQPFDTSGFHIESVQGVPRQMNGSDCGVFSCMFAEYITRGREITFAQQHMEYFRQKMILEIVSGELLQ